MMISKDIKEINKQTLPHTGIKIYNLDALKEIKLS